MGDTVIWRGQEYHIAGTYHQNYSCVLTGCDSSYTLHLVNLPVPVVNLGPDTTVCTGQTFTFDAGFCKGCTYQWANLTLGLMNIGTSQTFTATQSGLYMATVTGTNGCKGRDTVNLTIGQPFTVGVSISTPLNTVCAGTSVTFTATPAYPGSTPVYQWKVNGVNVGSNSDTYSYVPLNGDVVSCVLTSSLTTCVSNNPATSNSVTMTVSSLMSVGLSIAAVVNPVCSGSAVTINANPINPGGSPVYQWKVNGVNTGLNLSSFTYTPVNSDIVTCELLSSLSCTSGNPAFSNSVTVSVKPLPSVTFSSCFDTVTSLNAQPYFLKGGVPIGGTYTGPGVNSVLGSFCPSVAGAGLKTITYSYQNSFSCSDSRTRNILVLATPVFNCGQLLTDPRDGKTYPTVLLGTQCWMQKNLDYGTMTSAVNHQKDNCVPEKYCYNDDAANCAAGGGLYQWDELMQYQDTPGVQGGCPPGWHVPTQAEWLTLFNFYQGQGIAGKPCRII